MWCCCCCCWKRKQSITIRPNLQWWMTNSLWNNIWKRFKTLQNTYIFVHFIILPVNSWHRCTYIKLSMNQFLNYRKVCEICNDSSRSSNENWFLCRPTNCTIRNQSTSSSLHNVLDDSALKQIMYTHYEK